MPVVVLPQAEVVLIAWAKATASILSLVATDADTGQPAIASSLPKTGEEQIPYPFLTFASDPGSLEVISAEGAALIDCFLQVDCYAKSKPVASTLVQTVLAELRVIHETPPAGRIFAGAFIHGGRMLVGARPFIERDHIYERFSTDIAVTIGPA